MFAAEIVKNAILMLSIIQCTFAACLILMGDTLYDQFDHGVFSNPQSFLQNHGISSRMLCLA